MKADKHADFDSFIIKCTIPIPSLNSLTNTRNLHKQKLHVQLFYCRIDPRIKDTSRVEKNTTVSSVNRRTLHSTTALGRSFIWRINNSGPKIDLRGAPTHRSSAALDTHHSKSPQFVQQHFMVDGMKHFPQVDQANTSQPALVNVPSDCIREAHTVAAHSMEWHFQKPHS